MALSWGNLEVFGLCYNGNAGVSAMYNGELVWPDSPAVQYPYLLFSFSVSDFVPTSSLVHAAYRYVCTWTQVSSSPNVWKLEIHRWAVIQEQAGRGLPYLFTNETQGYLVSANLGGGTCALIGSGNLDVELNGYYCESFDRMFMNCTGLTSISPMQCTHAINVGGMFSGCTGVEGGALAQYNWFSTYAVNINNHSGTFSSCGSDTVSGLAELNQIPVGWGGNLIPASTLMTSVSVAYTGSNKTGWKITDNGSPEWEDIWEGIVGMYLFTQASVSQYAGVSMNRTRIPNGLNGFSPSSGNALYFYPAFAQMEKIPGQSGNTVYWIATTDTPNGQLGSTQGNTDMPGTLDYSTYGPITRTYGTYDLARLVYFVFLVTNVPIENWGGLTDAMGFLYNSNFKTDGGFRYFY